jgi:hypothetical protein
MSNNLALFTANKLPAYLQDIELDATTKNLAGSSGGSGSKRISIKGSVFRMMVNGEELMVNEDRAMNVVIVASSLLGRTYYEGAYVEGGDAKPPSCWSPDNSKPASDVPEPQATTCMSCPQNIAGSGTGESRACRYNQRVAVVLEGDLGGDVYQLSLPATSIFGKGVDGAKLPLQAYVQSIVQMRLPIGAVVTEMRFDTASATPKLIFSPIRPLDENEYAICKEKGTSAEATRAVTMTVFQADSTTANKNAFAPAPQAVAIAPPKPKAKPAPVVEESDDDVPDEAAVEVMTSEPVKVSKVASAPAEKAGLTNLLDEWED